MPKTIKTMKRKTMKRKTMKKMWGGAPKKSSSKSKQHTAPMVGKPQKSISMKAFLEMFNALDVKPKASPSPSPSPVKDEMDMLADRMAKAGTTSSRTAARNAIGKIKKMGNKTKKTPYKNL
jgi:hypothetical protein